MFFNVSRRAFNPGKGFLSLAFTGFHVENLLTSTMLYFLAKTAGVIL